MKDRRQFQRFTADVLDMHGRSVFAKVARILDMSLGGVMVNTDTELNKGKKCILRVQEEESALDLESVVVWSALHENPEASGSDLVPPYKTGLKFTAVSRATTKKISRFIENHAQTINKQEVQQNKLSGYRMNVRVQLQAPANIMLIFHDGFRIKNLSLGGMLTESDDPLEIGERLLLKIFRSRTNTINVLGKVTSCIEVKENDSQHYDIGIAFKKMSGKDKELLRELMCLLETMCCIAPSNHNS
ncbi:MAG: PilZ domain-containing protein [Thermodesulfovibrionales bacterium]|nr:PilZ domain-containing protein [Thermodesulfovibrionales bacterium]